MEAVDNRPVAIKEIGMTTPDERTRAILWAGGFLLEVAHDKSLPVRLRRKAVAIARHYPLMSEIAGWHRQMNTTMFGSPLVPPEDVYQKEDFPQGAITCSTRTAWPEKDADPEPG